MPWEPRCARHLTTNPYGGRRRSGLHVELIPDGLPELIWLIDRPLPQRLVITDGLWSETLGEGAKAACLPRIGRRFPQHIGRYIRLYIRHSAHVGRLTPGTARLGAQISGSRYRELVPIAAANGIEIAYEDEGSGPPILFVMGLGGQLVDWPDDFIEMFRTAGFRTIVFDNRDIGLSTQSDWEPPSRRKSALSALSKRATAPAGYTMIDMANDAAGLLDALNIEAAHVVGMSMGGMIAQELAIGHTSRVLSLCSVMSNTGDRRRGGMAASLLPAMARRPTPQRETAVQDSIDIFRLIAGPAWDEAEHRKRAEQSVVRAFTPQGVARQTAAIMATRDRTALLENVAVPTLVIHGLADPLVKFSGGVATAKAVPQARLLAFPDMGHDLPRPRWTEMRDAIVANLQRTGELIDS